MRKRKRRAPRTIATWHIHVRPRDGEYPAPYQVTIYRGRYPIVVEEHASARVALACAISSARELRDTRLYDGRRAIVLAWDCWSSRPPPVAWGAGLDR